MNNANEAATAFSSVHKFWNTIVAFVIQQNDNLNLMIQNINPNAKQYTPIFVALIWCSVVVIIVCSILLTFKFGAGLFEETSHIVDNPNEENRDIPDLEPVEDNLPLIPDLRPDIIENANTIPKDQCAILGCDADKDENVIVALTSYNAKKTSIERELWDIKIDSRKKVISNIKEELNLVRDKVLSSLRSNLLKKCAISEKDLEESGDLVLFTLISQTARSRVIDNLADSFDDGGFDLHEGETIKTKARRKAELLRQVYLSAFHPLPVKVKYFTYRDVEIAFDSIFDDIVKSMISVMEFAHSEMNETDTTITHLEDELNKCFAHIIEIIDDVQNKCGLITLKKE